MPSETSVIFYQLMSDGEIIRSAPYQDLLAYCQEFQLLVNVHKDTIGVSDLNRVGPHRANEILIKGSIDILSWA